MAFNLGKLAGLFKRLAPAALPLVTAAIPGQADDALAAAAAPALLNNVDDVAAAAAPALLDSADDIATMATPVVDNADDALAALNDPDYLMDTALSAREDADYLSGQLPAFLKNEPQDIHNLNTKERLASNRAARLLGVDDTIFPNNFGTVGQLNNVALPNDTRLSTEGLVPSEYLHDFSGDVYMTDGLHRPHKNTALGRWYAEHNGEFFKPQDIDILRGTRPHGGYYNWNKD